MNESRTRRCVNPHRMAAKIKLNIILYCFVSVENPWCMMMAHIVDVCYGDSRQQTHYSFAQRAFLRHHITLSFPHRRWRQRSTSKKKTNPICFEGIRVPESLTIRSGNDVMAAHNNRSSKKTENKRWVDNKLQCSAQCNADDSINPCALTCNF